jgi:hypothetical protein
VESFALRVEVDEFKGYVFRDKLKEIIILFEVQEKHLVVFEKFYMDSTSKTLVPVLEAIDKDENIKRFFGYMVAEEGYIHRQTKLASLELIFQKPFPVDFWEGEYSFRGYTISSSSKRFNSNFTK